MNATTKSGGIFTFDHGQKKLNNAIGVEQEYLDDLGTQVADLLKDFLFDEDKNIRDDISPSALVEICANEFSYSQLVVLSSFYLQETLDGFAKKIERKLDDMKSSVKSINLDSEDLPPHIKDMLKSLTEGKTNGSAIDGDTLPPELKDFLNKLAEEQERQEGDGDDD
jgi:hypothetical protein